MRDSLNGRNAGYPNDLAEMPLMRKAFPMGREKNPASYRIVDMTPEREVRLIAFASHLPAVVEERTVA